MADRRHQAGPDTVVHFGYRLWDGEGELAESTDPELPISFLFGYGQLSPEFERAFAGCSAGDRRKVTLKPEHAYGHRDTAALIAVDRNEFPPGLAVGDEFEADSDGGDVVALKVLEIDGDSVILDTNHPLAGQTVTVEVAVEAVRPATSAEIAQAEEELASGKSASETLLPGSLLVRRPAPGSS